MQVTDVRVRRVEKDGKMKAIVSITLDNEFVIHDIKVIEGEKGLFIAMPSRKAADGEYRDIAHPINSGTRDMICLLYTSAFFSTGLMLSFWRAWMKKPIMSLGCSANRAEKSYCGSESSRISQIR